MLLKDAHSCPDPPLGTRKPSDSRAPPRFLAHRLSSRRRPPSSRNPPTPPAFPIVTNSLSNSGGHHIPDSPSPLILAANHRCELVGGRRIVRTDPPIPTRVRAINRLCRVFPFLSCVIGQPNRPRAFRRLLGAIWAQCGPYHQLL